MRPAPPSAARLLHTGLASGVRRAVAQRVAARLTNPVCLRCLLPCCPLQVDCGYVGINQQICQSKGCCWNPSGTSGVPWCFYGAGTSNTCYAPQSGLSTPFNASEVATMRGYFLANINIQGKGGIVAAPDFNTPGGEGWDGGWAVRDGMGSEEQGGPTEARSPLPQPLYP